MTTTIVCSIAVVSTMAVVTLWFWVAQQELGAQQRSVEEAKYQLTASRQHYMRVRDSYEGEQAKEIIKSSQSSYRQTLKRYNQSLRKPWNVVPAFLLGFRQIGEGDGTKENETGKDQSNQQTA